MLTFPTTDTMLSTPSTYGSSLIDDVRENGAIYLTFTGCKFALGFKGDPSFLQRCFNLCMNRGIVGPIARLRLPFGPCGRFAYVVTQSKKRIARGLAEQFRSEIIMAREVEPLSESVGEDGEYDVQWNEPVIAAMAEERARAFMEDHVENDDFITKLRKSGVTVSIGRTSE